MPTRPNKPKVPIAKTASATGTEAVDDFMSALSHPLKREVAELRRIILASDPRVTEGIKWNVPSFHAGDWFATFDLRAKDWVQIILHRGAKVKRAEKSRYVTDRGQLLKWITHDRCVARFTSREDVNAKAAALSEVVSAWVGKLCAEQA